MTGNTPVSYIMVFVFFRLLRLSNGSEELPLNCTIPFVTVWEDSVMLCSLCWQLISGITLKSPSLLTRSNDLVSSVRVKEKNICCSQHFFWSCQTEKTTSTFDPSARKPNDLSKLLDVDDDDPSKDFSTMLKRRRIQSPRTEILVR